MAVSKDDYPEDPPQALDLGGIPSVGIISTNCSSCKIQLHLLVTDNLNGQLLVVEQTISSSVRRYIQQYQKLSDLANIHMPIASIRHMGLASGPIPQVPVTACKSLLDSKLITTLQSTSVSIRHSQLS